MAQHQGILGAVLLTALLLIQLSASAPTSNPEEIAKICRVALEVQDPVCKHGGYLRAENYTDEPTSCGDCICPEGWDGVDCSLCTTKELCPPLTPPDGGPPIPASACITNSIVPTVEEAPYGKLISCWCGADEDDSSTAWVCGQQPVTNWDIWVYPSNSTFDWATGNAAAMVNERAGVYSQDNVPEWPCKAGNECFRRDRWDYAYPGVWDGQFSGCSWKQGECITPMEGDDCWVYTCTGSQVYCPSSYAKKCPGWTPVSCGVVPDGNRPYWTHHCLPGTFPAPDKNLKLACKPHKGPDGFFQCYITQEGSYVSSLGMKCKVGNCVYSRPPPPPPTPPPPQPPSDPGSDPSPEPAPEPEPEPSPDPSPPAPMPPPPPKPPKPNPKIKTEWDLIVGIGVTVAAVMALGAYITYADTREASAYMSVTGADSFGSEISRDQGPGGPGAGANARHTGGPRSAEQAMGLLSPLLPGADGDEEQATGDAAVSDRRTPSASGGLYRSLSDALSSAAGDDQPQRSVPVALSWHNLHVSVKRPGRKALHILRGVCGVAGPVQTGLPNGSLAGTGSMLAVLGPSGAGKTTLLDTLAGRRGTSGVRGEIRVNGMLASPAEIQAASGYVLQDDVLPGTLTVYEYLLFNAWLRLGSKTNSNSSSTDDPADRLTMQQRATRRRQAEQRRQMVVAQIIRELGLSKVAHSFIGDAFVRGLSGGEKRRVSIGCELLTRPGLLLLDEPTTGLDSTNAARVVDILAELAGRQGVTVLLSIHQPRPDIFRLMDRVLLLSGEGQVVFSGPVAAAAPHFEAQGLTAPHASVALADHLLDLVIRSSRAQVAAMVDAFSCSPVWQQDDAWVCSMADGSSPQARPAPKHCPSFWSQLTALSSRLLRNTTRHPFIIALNFTATLLLAITLAFIFYNAGTDTAGIQNRLGVLFFLLLYLSLMALSSLPIWRDERLLFYRERAAGLYGTPAYFLAVVMFDLLPLRVLPPSFFALITYPAVGLHPTCRSCILWFLSTLVGANITAAAMCMAIGAGTPTNSTANMVGSLTMMLLLLFGGFLLNKERVPAYCRWLSGTSLFNYAYEALAVNEFHGFPADFTFTAPIDSAALPPLRITGDGVLKEFGFEQEMIHIDEVMLWLLGIAFCGLAYVLLHTSGTDPSAAAGGALSSKLWGTTRALRAAVASAWRSLHAALQSGMQEHSDGRYTAPFLPTIHEGDEEEMVQEDGIAAMSDAESLFLGRGESFEAGSRQLSGTPLAAQSPGPAGNGEAGGVSNNGSNEEGQALGVGANGARHAGDFGNGSVGGEVNGGEADGLWLLSSSPEAGNGAGAKNGTGAAALGAGGPLPALDAEAADGDGQARPHGNGGLNGRGGFKAPLVQVPHPAVLQQQQHAMQRPPELQAGVPQPGPRQPLVLSWDNITCRVQLPRGASRYVLQGISGITAPVERLPLSHAGPRSPQSPTVLHGPEQYTSSCLFAIIGPSGAGKTTLLDLLAGRKQGPMVGGEVRVNGHLTSAEQIRRMSGYVHQEILLPGTSTVMEYLTFHAALRMPLTQAAAEAAGAAAAAAHGKPLPANASTAQRVAWQLSAAGRAAARAEAQAQAQAVRQRVHEVVKVLGLSKVAHSFIGDAFVRGLSGGEKRRVSIGCELLTRPGLLLLDEPTTGLDSTNAARVVDILAELAGRQGVTVLLSIHQPRPDIFRLMDRVMLLSGEGQVVYTGPTDRASAHFAGLGYTAPSVTTSIADHMLDVVIKAPASDVSRLVDAFRSSEVAGQDQQAMAELQLASAMQGGDRRARALTPLAKYESSFLAQVHTLAQRLGRQCVRHPLLIALNLVASAAMAMGIGGIYWQTGRDTGGIQDRFGSLFFMMLYLSLSSLSSLPIWRDDRLVFVRERAAGAYGTAAYFTAVVLFDFVPLRLLPPLLFSAISYPMIGLRSGFTFWLSNLLVLILHNMACASLSMALGAALPTVAAANMAGSLAVLTTSLLGGFLLSRNHMPPLLDYLAGLSYVRYSFEALLITEFHGADGYRFTAFHQPGAPPDQIPHIDVTGDQILQTFGFDLDTFPKDMLMLCVLITTFLSATFLLLRYKGRDV